MVFFLKGIENEVFNGFFLLYASCGPPFSFCSSVFRHVSFLFSELNGAYRSVVLWVNGLVELGLSD